MKHTTAIATLGIGCFMLQGIAWADPVTAPTPTAPPTYSQFSADLRSTFPQPHSTFPFRAPDASLDNPTDPYGFPTESKWNWTKMATGTGPTTTIPTTPTPTGGPPRPLPNPVPAPNPTPGCGFTGFIGSCSPTPAPGPTPTPAPGLTDTITVTNTCGPDTSQTQCMGSGNGSLSRESFIFNFGRPSQSTVQAAACDFYNATKNTAISKETALLAARGRTLSGVTVTVNVSGTFQWRVNPSTVKCYPIECPLVSSGSDCSGGPPNPSPTPSPAPAPGPGPGTGGTITTVGDNSCINNAINTLVNANNSNTTNLMTLAAQVGGATQQAIQNLISQVNACVNQRTVTPCTPPVNTGAQQRQIDDWTQEITTKQNAVDALDIQIGTIEQQAASLLAQAGMWWNQWEQTGSGEAHANWQSAQNQWTSLQGQLGTLNTQKQQLTQEISMLQMQKSTLQQQIQQMTCSKTTVRHDDCSTILSGAVPSFAGPQQAAIQNAATMLNTAYMNLAMCGQQ